MDVRKASALLLVSGIALLAAGCGNSDSDSGNSSDQLVALEKEVVHLEQENERLANEIDQLKQENSKLEGQLDETRAAESGGSGASGLTYEYEQFQSPSSHIHCGISGEYGARCESDDKTWDPGPQPASCNLDWGAGLTVGPEGEGQVLCAGDTVISTDSPVLKYGAVSRIGSYSCESSESGVTCTNTDTGHGFRIAKADFLLF